ncbi:hypothetical protein niasHS_017963 [Heterodera schachtii]|uniref:Uncharacterized protein n=1 Tax=Heterodera schachtii TaxID=97005 RepID=A0ABD2HXC8_HETSC
MFSLRFLAVFLLFALMAHLSDAMDNQQGTHSAAVVGQHPADSSPIFRFKRQGNRRCARCPCDNHFCHQCPQCHGRK